MILRTAPRWPLVVVAAAALAIGAAHLVGLATVGNTVANPDLEASAEQAMEVVATLAAVLSGAVILMRRPGSWVGRGLLAAGLALVSNSGSWYAGYAYPRGLPLAVPTAIIAAAVYLPSLAALAAIFASFPGDRPRSRLAWSAVVIASVAAALGAAFEIVIPGTLYNLDRFGVANPLGVAALADLPIHDIARRTIDVALAATAIGLLVRGVRSEERRPFVWVGAAVAVLLVSKGAGVVFDVPSAVTDIAFMFLPVTIAIAVLREGLDEPGSDIDASTPIATSPGRP